MKWKQQPNETSITYLTDTSYKIFYGTKAIYQIMPRVVYQPKK